ncbi:MAG: hypothetical protein IPN94_02215 [Sphingobacteriales bacterium]|nr:hypothetical protein [Sphingobacteriales bacterium]
MVVLRRRGGRKNTATKPTPCQHQLPPRNLNGYARSNSRDTARASTPNKGTQHYQ